MSAADTPAWRVRKWLKDNLGKHCLGCLTGQSAKSLGAAVQIVNLYSYCDGEAEPHVVEAFRRIVLTTHEDGQERELIYHSIAMVMEWSTRDQLWARCQLPTLKRRRLCAHEPGGSARGTPG